MVFVDGFIRNKKEIITPVMSPVSTERNMTIAREASNFQKKKDIITGMAFWTENIATNKIITKTIKIVAIISFF